MGEGAGMDRLKVIRNGEKVTPTFSTEEMSRRLARLREVMAGEGVDAALFTSYHNINYYSDFLYCSFGRPYGLVVTRDEATTISANIDGGQPWRRSFGDNVIFTDWQRDNYFEAVKSLIADGGPAGGRAGGRIGVEFDHLNLENHAKLQAALPGSEIVDIAKAVMRQRMVKSAEEIAVIRNGARIADIGGAACVEAIAVGVPEHEVALHSTRAMVREIARTYPHAELMDTWTWFQSGLNTDGAHNPVTSRRIEAGDILSLNCFPMIAGYYTALERTLFAEHASERHLALWEVNCKVHRRGLELIRPGARCCDIAAELNDIYEAHDLLDPLLRPRGGPRAARGHRDRAGAGHGGLHGAHDHAARGHGGRRRLPRARHPGGRRGRRREHHQVPVWAGAQHRGDVAPVPMNWASAAPCRAALQVDPGEPARSTQVADLP
jgi:creatinase